MCKGGTHILMPLSFCVKVLLAPWCETKTKGPESSKALLLVLGFVVLHSCKSVLKLLDVRRQEGKQSRLLKLFCGL